jgi:spore germination protein KC
VTNLKNIKINIQNHFRCICPKNLKILIIFILLFTTGCKYFPEQKEISVNDFILAMGIDKGIENKENLRITLVAKNLKSTGWSKSDGNAQDEAVILKSESTTMFDTIRQIHEFGEKHIFLGHLRYIIIGEELSKENINEIIDFFINDHEIRMNIVFAIAKGATAEDILDSGKEYKGFVPDLLKSLYSDIGGNSISKKITVKDVAISLDSKFSDTLISSICKKKAVNKNGDLISYIELNGYAIFKEFKLLDFITNNVARGANFINNDAKSGSIIVKDNNGENICLEIIEADSKVEPKINDNNLEINIKINVTSNIGEIEGQENISSEEAINQLINQQTNIVMQEAQSAINFSQKNGVDIFRIGDAINHKYPLQWDEMKNNWRETYKNLKISTNVQTKINRVYLRMKPIGSD